ncbi:MAG: ATP-binding cassette domain-containing protein, partial [Spirochaetota bacterium]
MDKILELKGITKQFPGVKALDQVNLNVYPGKVMGLLGENGAGKSTLMKILSGVYTPDAGRLLWQGQELTFSGIHAAKKQGISIIHQELSLLPELSIAENIFLDQLPVSQWGKIRWKEIYRKAKDLLRIVQVQREPQQLLKELSISEQQLVEIAKNLAKDSRVVIMDEPTDSLTDREVENLFAIIRKLKNSGKSVIYITHRLNEVFQICDDVTVLRDGTLVCESPCGEMNEAKLIQAMVGRELTEQFPRASTAAHREPILELRGVSNRKVKNIDLTIHSGEILGLLGLMGAGRTELGRTIYGYYPADSGSILWKGREIRLRSPAAGISQKIVYVSEDRKSDGLVLKLSVKENMVLSALPKFENKFMKIQRHKEEQAVRNFIEEFQIKT